MYWLGTEMSLCIRHSYEIVKPAKRDGMGKYCKHAFPQQTEVPHSHPTFLLRLFFLLFFKH